MINNSTQNISNTSFGASVNMNRQLILNNISKDKKVTSEDISSISKLLDKVDSFSKMKEDSVVDVSTIVDSWQTKIVINVYDKTKRFFHPVVQRVVSLLSRDEIYREKHLSSVKALIKNVDKTRIGIDKITQAIMSSKNIKGGINNNSELRSEDIKKCFENYHFTNYFIKSLDNGYNPTKRIIDLIKAVDKNAKNGTELSINICSKKSEKCNSNHSYFILSYKNGNKVEEKSILLSELFKKPLEDRLIQ